MGAHNELGVHGEDVAAAYLVGQGFEIEDRNWRGDGGELDILATRGRLLVGVEVKTRRTMDFGDPLAAVDTRKLARVWRLLTQWAFEHPDVRRGRELRVDVIGIILGETLVHIEDVR